MQTDPNVEAIRARLLERSAVGIEKYGVTTARDDMTREQWLRHLQEELLDAAVYVEAAIAPAGPVSLVAAANLALNALHECIAPKGAEKQVSDAMRALQSALDRERTRAAELRAIDAIADNKTAKETKCPE